MKRKAKFPYAEGDWFVVPLRSGGNATGIIARMDGKGGIIGYFFGPVHGTPPSLAAIQHNRPDEAILVANFGDLGLARGEWKVLGRSSVWDREAWPVPAFVRRDAVTGTPKKVIYRELNFDTEIALLPCSPEEAELLPRDGVMGYGAVEIRLTSLLSASVKQAAV